jgi:hypothetical protein
MSHKKYGVPRSAVIMPDGTSDGARIILPL